MEKQSILEIMIDQVEIRLNRPLTPVEKPVITNSLRDTAAMVEKRLSVAITEAVERIKHDTGI